jgi:hypothetical protein
VHDRGGDGECVSQNRNYWDVFLAGVPLMGIKSQNPGEWYCLTLTPAFLRPVMMRILRALLQICNRFCVKKSEMFAFVASLRRVRCVPFFPKSAMSR